MNSPNLFLPLYQMCYIKKQPSMFLNADCVFAKLIKNNILESTERSWKIINRTQTASYYCEFFIYKKKLRCIKSFQIVIQDGKHLLLSKNIEALLANCNDHDKEYIQDVLDACVA